MTKVIDYGDDVAPRPHKLFVKAYNETFACHECLFDGTKTVFVDLFVNGDLSEITEPQELVGKTVQVDYTHGFLWLAMNVQIVRVAREALAKAGEA